METFKIRCSAIGQIMTNPRSKSETLSKTTQSYCETWLKERLYNSYYEFSSKFTEKGLIVEDQSIDFIADNLGYGFLIKNEDHFENEHLTGTPDIITNDTIIDVKNSWDCFSFPIFEYDIPNKDYWYQLQGYMALTGKEKARLIYVLSDTPENLIEREAYWWCKNNGFDDLDMDVYKRFLKNKTYPDVQNNLKIKTFEITRDNEAIQAIYDRVELCREYIETLKQKI